MVEFKSKEYGRLLQKKIILRQCTCRGNPGELSHAEEVCKRTRGSVPAAQISISMYVCMLQLLCRAIKKRYHI